MDALRRPPVAGAAARRPQRERRRRGGCSVAAAVAAALLVSLPAAQGRILPAVGTCPERVSLCDSKKLGDYPDVWGKFVPQSKARPTPLPATRTRPIGIIPREDGGAPTRYGAPMLRRQSSGEWKVPGTDLATGITTIISGNAGVADLMLNAASSIAAMNRPWQHFLAPLDPAALHRLMQNASAHHTALLVDPFALESFGGLPRGSALPPACQGVEGIPSRELAFLAAQAGSPALTQGCSFPLFNASVAATRAAASAALEAPGSVGPAAYPQPPADGTSSSATPQPSSKGSTGASSGSADRSNATAAIAVGSEAEYGHPRFNALARYKWALAGAVLNSPRVGLPQFDAAAFSASGAVTGGAGGNNLFSSAGAAVDQVPGVGGVGAASAFSPPPAYGNPVLVVDPDIVHLRNPIPYLSSLPECDLTFQAEMGAIPLLFDPAVQEATMRGLHRMPGFSPPPYGWINSGFMMLRPNDRVRKLVDILQRFFEVSDSFPFVDEAGNSRPRGDQAILSLILATAYGINTDMVAGSKPLKRSARVRQTLQQGQCVRFIRNPTHEAWWLPGRSDPRIAAILAELPEELSLWILNPVTFPTYPIVFSTDLCEVAMEQPYLLHYNWMKGAGTKAQAMADMCHWWGEPPLQGQEGKNATTAKAEGSASTRR